jgi:hypothetical protein
MTAVDELFSIEPTTLLGTLALLRFAEGLVANDDLELVEENSTVLVATLAASVAALASRGVA